MGWFDRQIRQRKDKDQEIFEESILGMASAVLGKRAAGALSDERIVAKAAIDEILKYYHIKPVDIPDTLKTTEEQLEYALRPHGIMYRRVTLSEDWYKNAFGPMIAFTAEEGLPLVLLPKNFGGYCWDSGGKRITAGKNTEGLLRREAICFYSPLPLKKIGIPDLLSYMKNCLNWSDYAFLLALTLLVAAAGMLVPRITKLVSGFVLESGSEVILWSTALFMFCVLISAQLISASRELALTRLQGKVGLPMEAAMMMRLMSLPAPFFRQYPAGELATRSNAVNRLTTLLLGGVFSTGITAVASLLYINQIFLYAPALGFPALIINLAMLAATLLIGYLRMKQQREYMLGEAEESGVSYAIISGIQKIKLSGAEKRAFARWAKLYAEGAEVKYDPAFILKISPAVTLAISLMGTVALYWYAANSEVTPSDWLAALAAYGTVSGAFTAFANISVSAAQIGPILEMAEPILKAEPEVAEGKEIVTRLSGAIELSGVAFRYSDTTPYIIDGLDLKIRPGEYVAVVGRTGCGKSTLLRLLLGFESPEKGAVYYDKRDIRSLDLSSLRRHMGVITQNGSLILGDIYSNITVSAPDLTLDDAWDAAEKAGIAEDIRAMPMGMHTIIGEGTGGVSGGQKQRLLIARAIAPKPKILLFDEATSALDNRTQKKVADALSGLNCTRIVIAHRLSTVKNCDRILVLEGGKIAEEGKYEELIEKGGLFAELVERQRI